MEFEVPANLSDNERIRLEQLEMLVRERNLTVEDLIQNFTHFNNKDDDSIDPQEYLSGMFSLKIFFYLFYLLIFVLGLAGNALVCYVVIRNKSMHNVTNVFITNLALSDILLCIFAVPFTPLYLLTFKAWVFGKLFCHLVPYAQGVSVYISAFTLMAIAIDRFFVIIHPFKPRMAMYTCGLIIVTIWIVSCILTLPYGLFVELIPFDEEVLFCDEKWPFEESRRAFSLTTSVLQFVIPFIIISYCYYRVCAKLSGKMTFIQFPSLLLITRDAFSPFHFNFLLMINARVLDTRFIALLNPLTSVNVCHVTHCCTYRLLCNTLAPFLSLQLNYHVCFKSH